MLLLMLLLDDDDEALEESPPLALRKWTMLTTKEINANIIQPTRRGEVLLKQPKLVSFSQSSKSLLDATGMGETMRPFISKSPIPSSSCIMMIDQSRPANFMVQLVDESVDFNRNNELTSSSSAPPSRFLEKRSQSVKIM